VIEMMRNPLDLKIEAELSRAKLKRPNEEQMSHFLSGVHNKINQGPLSSGPQVLQSVSICTLGLVAMGFVFFLIAQPQMVKQAQVAESHLTAQEQIRLLEFFEVDTSSDIMSVMDVEALFSEIAFLDEIESQFLAEISELAMSQPAT
jgi:hypothetical protein